MLLGIGSYTYVWWSGVPGYPRPADLLTPSRLLDVAQSLSVDVVQIADNMPLSEMPLDALRQLASQAESLGIALEAGTRGIQRDHLLRYLDICNAMGARLLRTMIDDPAHRPSAVEAADLIQQCAKDFESAGVTLAIENHERFRATELREIVEKAGSLAVGICLDTANSLGCGESIDTVLARVADFVVNLHVKDFSVSRLPHNKGFVVEGAPAGQGLLDIPAIIKYLQRCGRDFNVILEQWPSAEETPEQSVEKEKRWAEESLEFLRPLVAKSRMNAGQL